MIQLNIGCGSTITKGRKNYDNSPSIWLSSYMFLVKILITFKFLNKSQIEYIKFCSQNNVLFCDAIKRIPEKENSVSTVYCSHMLEHFDLDEAKSFLNEVSRVLKNGGALRIAVPDLKKQINQYLQKNDADYFMKHSLLCVPRPKSFSEKIRYLIFGNRNHLWMYDETSLINLLKENGFINCKSYLPGETSIQNPGELNLYERDHESLYVEANKP